MGRALRDVYGECLAEYARQNNKVIALDADLANCSKTCIMAETVPERVFDVGIAENHMAAMGAGFASCGFIPFVNTFAALAASMCSLTAKALIGYSGLNVRIMGANNGLSGGYDGATHHSFDDINVMRGIPGMLVMTPSDAVMMKWMVKTLIEDYKGPAYVGIPRNGYETLYQPDETFEIGKARQITEGKDAAVLACGLSVYRAVKAAELLETEGIHVRIYDMFTIKPLDRGAVIAAARETGAIVTVEEHSVIGGLGTAVLEVLAEEGIKTSVKRLGIQDCYTESGSYEDLVDEFGIGIRSIADAVKEIMEKELK